MSIYFHILPSCGQIRHYKPQRKMVMILPARLIFSLSISGLDTHNKHAEDGMKHVLCLQSLTGLKSCGFGFLYDSARYFPVLTNISSDSRASGGLCDVMKFRQLSLLWLLFKIGGRNIPVLLFVSWGSATFECVFVSFLWGTARDLYGWREKSGGLMLHTSLWLAVSVSVNHLLLANESCWLAEYLILSSKQTEDSGCSKLYGAISTSTVLPWYLLTFHL